LGENCKFNWVFLIKNSFFSTIDEQERVQKKTFVNWINSHLQKVIKFSFASNRFTLNLTDYFDFQRIPPLKISNLFEDLKDGTKLLALLEVLSGTRLPHEKGKFLRKPHFISNCNIALEFLKSKQVNLEVLALFLTITNQYY